MKSITKKYRVMMEIDDELYDRWRQHVLLIYGIKSAGGKANIMEFNSKVFSEAMERMMGGSHGKG